MHGLGRYTQIYRIIRISILHNARPYRNEGTWDKNAPHNRKKFPNYSLNSCLTNSFQRFIFTTGGVVFAYIRMRTRKKRMGSHSGAKVPFYLPTAPFSSNRNFHSWEKRREAFHRKPSSVTKRYKGVTCNVTKRYNSVTCNVTKRYKGVTTTGREKSKKAFPHPSYFPPSPPTPLLTPL